MDWPTGDGQRIVVYLRPRHLALPVVLELLATADTRAVCVIPGAAPEFIAKHANDKIAIHPQAVALGPLLDSADAMIGYAGTGTLSEALLKGVPQLMIPATMEQYLGARRVEEMGAGIMIDARHNPTDMREALSRLMGEPSYKQQAKTFAQRHAAFCTEQAAAKAADQILEQLGKGDKR